MSDYDSPLAMTKRQLYGMLLSIDDPTENEVEIMFYLAKDKDVQAFLKAAIEREKRRGFL